MDAVNNDQAVLLRSSVIVGSLDDFLRRSTQKLPSLNLAADLLLGVQLSINIKPYLREGLIF